MQVTARAEYALRAAMVLASAGPGPVKSEAIAAGTARRRAGEALRAVWAVLRANERAVLESVTLADLVAGRLPQTSPVGRAAST